MSTTKVVFVHHSGQLGGAPKSLGYLLGHLHNVKYKKVLVNVFQDGPIQKVLQAICADSNTQYINTFRIRPFHGSTVAPKNFINFFRNLLYLVPSLFRSYLMLKRLSPDLVYLNSSCLFVIALACKMNTRRVKVICHLREPIRRSISGRITKYFVSRCCDGIVSISQADLKSYGRKVRLLPHEVIHNITKLEGDVSSIKSKFFLRNRLNICTDAVIFLFLGRFAKGNGVENLVEIAKKVTSTRGDFHFVLAGKSPTDNIESGTNKNIHILPFQNDIHWLLQGCDVFVCPFTEPHFARGIVEASTYGLPCIGRGLGAINELIVHEETGLLCNDDESIEHAIIKLGDNKLLRTRFGNNAKEFSQANFDPEKLLSKNSSFIEKFLPFEAD